MTGPCYEEVPYDADVRAYVDAAWTAGYRAGFEARADIGAARVLVALKEGWPDLTALSPTYAGWRARLDVEPECAPSLRPVLGLRAAGRFFSRTRSS